MKFTFLTRDLLWLTVVVAFGVLWWRDRVELNGYREEKLVAQHQILGKSPATLAGKKLSDPQIVVAISNQISAAKRSGGLQGFNLELQIEDGTVWLTGRVASPKHLARV